MSRSPINCTIETGLAMWSRMNAHIIPSKVLENALQTIRNLEGTPSRDETLLKDEIAFRQDQVRKFHTEINELSAELFRLHNERRIAKNEQAALLKARSQKAKVVRGLGVLEEVHT